MIGELKRRLREQSEHYLLLDAAKRLGKGAPSTVKGRRSHERSGLRPCQAQAVATSRRLQVLRR